jgi:hypothetical protein
MSCLRKKKPRTTWGIFLHSYTQPHPKQGMKKILRHFLNTLKPPLTLQISYIVLSSLESPTLGTFCYYFLYSRSRCLVTWQREVKLCKVIEDTRVVGKCLRNNLIPCIGSGCVPEWMNIPQTVRKKIQNFNTKWIVALRSVNKIFPESYNFAASRNGFR